MFISMDKDQRLFAVAARGKRLADSRWGVSDLSRLLPLIYDESLSLRCMTSRMVKRRWFQVPDGCDGRETKVESTECVPQIDQVK